MQGAIHIDQPARGAGLIGLGAVFVVAAVALLGVFRGAEWYADHVAVPRYCADPAAAVARVGRILSVPRPAGNGATRPYIVAAKLIHLVPQRAGEATPAYLARLRDEIERRCA